MKKILFEITEDHIKLIGAMYMSFNDNMYSGAPSVNIKRPYGNSDLVGDIVEILELSPPEGVDEDSAEYEDWLEGGTLSEECLRIHQETAKAIQIIFKTHSFVPGFYEGDHYMERWSLISKEDVLFNQVKNEYEEWVMY